jgi:acetate---CoA ligase (ADP-forming)
MGSQLVERARSALDAANLPTYPFPERAASALAILTKRAEYLRSLHEISEIPQAVKSGQLPRDLGSMQPDEIIEASGIATASIRLASSAEQAASLAEDLGFPVVLKIASPDILHKSDVGGILTNLRSREAVIDGYAKIIESVRVRQPSALVVGLDVQKQVPLGQDVILGVVNDPTFGPLVMFGSGGIEAEALRDVAFALAPLNASEAAELMQRTWAGRRLDGFRSIPAADKAAVQDALVRLSWLASEHPQIKEIEINPLRVLAKGAIAIDVRLVL